MKSLIKLLTIIFAVVAIPQAQQPPHFQIRGSNSLLVSLNFNYDHLVKIDSVYKIRPLLRGSAVSDTLNIISVFNKIRIQSLSFSRGDTVYCSANKFPPSDSLQWRLWNPELDSLALRNSFLELNFLQSSGLHSYAQVTWHLKKKYTFKDRDTFTLILSEMPKIPPIVNVLQQKDFLLKPVKSRQSRMFVFMDSRTDWYRMEEQVHDPIFDVSGKRQLFAPKSSFIFIMPVVGR